MVQRTLGSSTVGNRRNCSCPSMKSVPAHPSLWRGFPTATMVFAYGSDLPGEGGARTVVESLSSVGVAVFLFVRGMSSRAEILGRGGVVGIHRCCRGVIYTIHWIGPSGGASWFVGWTHVRGDKGHCQLAGCVVRQTFSL